jgi:polyisoprenoid-binding protein YceI
MISKAILFFAAMTTVASASDVLVKMSLSPAGSFEATTAKLHGELTKTGEKYTADNIWVKTDDLKTGIDLRDEHFHKHLNSEKFPKITFTNVSAEGGKGSGTMTVCGVSNKVDFTYKPVTPKQLKANFKVKPSAFKLPEAKYLEIGVDDDVEVVATMDVK